MFTVFDIESTGLSPMHNDLIQFAYVTFDDNLMMLKSDVLYFFYEGMSWSDDAYEIHHIPMEELKKHADEFEANLIKMWTVLSGANVCGHNIIKFDCPFVTRWLERFGLSGLRFGIMQDTMVGFRPMNRGHDMKLSRLCELCDVDENVINQYLPIWFPESGATTFHNAAYDVAATAVCTILGLHKGYLSFDIKVVHNIDAASIDVNMLESSEPIKVPMLPESEQVYFKLIGNSGEIITEQFISNKEGFTDTSVLPTSIAFPYNLSEVDEGIYECVESGNTMRLQVTPIGDVFTVRNDMVCLSTPDLNLRKFTEGAS